MIYLYISVTAIIVFLAGIRIGYRIGWDDAARNWDAAFSDWRRNHP